MANFTTPFGAAAQKRLPTTTEKQEGFLCGPADRALFVGLFNRLESELGDLMSYAGVTGTDSDNTQVRQAILALISAATGGNPAGYVLMTQARARLPIFPETLTVDGKIICTSPATGTVRLPGGVSFLHRGIFTVTTAQTDFATAASKTYHLRWDATNGFRLLDLANVVYNSTAAAEISGLFDSTYDDMLLARVVTNSSNVPTITNLSNKAQLRLLTNINESFTRISQAQGGLAAPFTPVDLNWSRTPQVSAIVQRTGYSAYLARPPEDPFAYLSGTVSDSTGSVDAGVDRYRIRPVAYTDTNIPDTNFTFGYQLALMALT